MSDRYVEREVEWPDYVELRRSQPVARREYKCAACDRPIPKGTKYARIVGKQDGKMFNEAFHDFNANCVMYI